MRRPSIALVLLLVAPLACAQVYKWTDAHGTTHYSESPPPQGTKYSQVSVSSGSAAPAASNTDGNTTASGANNSDAQSNTPAPPAAPMADTPENRAKLCASLKASIATLQGSGPVVMQAPGGQQQLLNADQRKQQLTASQSQYGQFCGT
ncbi:MAG TPA: DUF4124 domain-containing protein [Dyella sp.]|nr:DUF4124 domain-containing protein [Dyella sp.]